MRCGPATLAALTLLVGLVPAAAGERQPSPQIKCIEDPWAKPLRICTQLDESALSGLGRSTTWRVWVEGDGSPIQVRLHNSSPGVIRLKGGNDQILHMGCRWHREVRRKVTAIGPGKARLEARSYSPSPNREAATIAAALAARLAQIKVDFIERRSRLPQSPDDSSEAVAELLNTTESELLDALSYQELAALRDYVQVKFREARDESAEARSTSSAYALPSSGPRIVFASYAPPGKGSIPKGKGNSVLDRALTCIERLYELAIKDDLVADLCVTSDPETGAKFVMWPRSYNRVRETSTTGKITGLYRGLYIYKVSKGFKKSIACLEPGLESCGPIDLVDDVSPALHCSFDEHGCKRQDLPQGGCRGN